MELEAASVDELFQLARSSQDPDAYWACVAQLHERGGERAFKLAEVLCDSILAGERCLGADVLGQLGDYAEGGRPVLRRLMDEDEEPAVLAAAAAGAGFLRDAEAKSRLEALVEHSEVGVRYAALHALVRLEDDEPSSS
jgi:HEAT repeat protein